MIFQVKNQIFLALDGLSHANSFIYSLCAPSNGLLVEGVDPPILRKILKGKRIIQKKIAEICKRPVLRRRTS